VTDPRGDGLLNSDILGHREGWLPSWDNEMAELLMPLVKANHPPKLKMFFFANTFPLAYHYAIALQNSGKHDPTKYIELSNWGDRKQQGVLAYTSSPRDGTSGRLRNLPITIFKPKWAFIPLTLSSQSVWGALDQPMTLSGFLAKPELEAYEDFAIYAELQELGGYLQGRVQETLRELGKAAKRVQVFFSQGARQKLPLVTTRKSTPNLLRLFIYGGSLSSYLSHKTGRYLRLSLEEGKECSKILNTFLRCPAIFAEPLQKYHKKLYASAKRALRPVDTKACPPFFTVYRSYNEMAWLLQHRSSFENAEDFAQCLADHNAGLPLEP
jgi:hypothetical protein